MNDWEDAALARVLDKSATVAVVGCGYVGLTLAAGAARAGLRVLGIAAMVVLLIALCPLR